MKLVVHIGTEKTGSSSLQLWGAKNRANLKNSGVFYSKVLGDIDHRKASVYPLTYGVNDDGFDRFGITSEEAFVSFKQELKQSLEQEISDAKNLGCHYFFVSSEHFHSRILTDEMVNEVKELFTSFFAEDDILILAYLRPQAELFQSRISVGVRNMTHSPGELDNLWKRDVLYFDYLSLWIRWSQAFSNVMFKPFNKFKNIISDVCSILGIDINDYETPERVNEKLDYRMGLISFNLRNRINNINLNRELVNLYLEQIPCKEAISISRKLASEINSFYYNMNIELCKVNPNFTLNDLSSDVRKFPVHGTAEKMFSFDENINYLIDILVRNYLLSHLLRCENQFITVERAMARKNIDNARNFKVKLEEMLSKLNGIQFEKADLKDVEHQINQLKNKVKNLKIEG
ncbi:TPA: hypothetical protein NJ199_004494 [Vibrio parahaemolyticus]|nr:hypothetical protein [Vibrio parahaemolyticus]